MTTFHVPTAAGPIPIEIGNGETIVLLGANGSGKTRLGVRIEAEVGHAIGVHRIGAHRSLMMNTKVPPPSFDIALKRLHYGYDEGSEAQKIGHRWQNKPATMLLSDFDHVMAALYADENRTAVLHRQAHLKDAAAKPPSTKLDELKAIWQILLPHRELSILDADLRVKPAGDAGNEYDAAELSDGERVIFYLIGQCLLAKPGIIILDEPELHINKSILSKLWDALESARTDCGFIYLTHDIEFASSRRAAARYAVQSYQRVNGEEQWELIPMPDETGLPEDVVTKIIGSRQPILFVEGDGGSLDASIYRRVYDAFTAIPVGGCENVIHGVATFRKHAALHRVGCAGLIDADGRDDAEIAKLTLVDVFVLHVSEVENLLLLPGPFTALAKLLQFDLAAAQEKLVAIQAVVFTEAANDVDRFCLDYTRRRIDTSMKAIGLVSKNVADLGLEFAANVEKIDVASIYATALAAFEGAVKNKDYEKVLQLYDRKSLLGEAARLLDLKGRKELEQFVGRALKSEDGKELLAALKAVLPTIN